MTPVVLAGDPEALYMACPLEAASELARRLPPGPVLELCCGAGGLTRTLARGRRVLAVDRDLSRIRANRANLDGMGLAGSVDYLCCDLARPALSPGQGFTTCVLDPDWSKEGDRPEQWTRDPAAMRPPAYDLLRLALSLSPRAVLRLPPGMAARAMDGRQPIFTLPHAPEDRVKFVFSFFGDWRPESLPGGPIVC